MFDVTLGEQVLGPVGFSAYASASVRYLEPYTTVVFDAVINNHRGGYNSATGVFTCPETGAQANALVECFFFWLACSLSSLCDVLT